MTDLGLTPPPTTGPNILLFDIENAPALGYCWGAYDQNIIEFKQDWYLLSFAYKWLNQKSIGFVSIYQDPAFLPDTTNDRWVAERLAVLFDMADVTVAHNGDKFDRRKANARFLYHDIDPPSPYRTIDTLKVARSEFAHMKNSLADLGRQHRLGGKTPHTGFRLWRQCMAGDPAAWKTMEKYNRQDVRLLEELYLKLLPWIGSPGKNSPINYGFWSDSMVCPKCGSGNLQKRGRHRTTVSEFQTYQCNNCRGYCRDRLRDRNHSPTLR